MNDPFAKVSSTRAALITLLSLLTVLCAGGE